MKGYGNGRQQTSAPGGCGVYARLYDCSLITCPARPGFMHVFDQFSVYVHVCTILQQVRDARKNYFVDSVLVFTKISTVVITVLTLV